ncbi:MAG: hypothetical protein ABL982_10720 [Vicinamibacterales bacterium]
MSDVNAAPAWFSRSICAANACCRPSAALSAATTVGTSAPAARAAVRFATSFSALRRSRSSRARSAFPVSDVALNSAIVISMARRTTAGLSTYRSMSRRIASSACSMRTARLFVQTDRPR